MRYLSLLFILPYLAFSVEEVPVSIQDTSLEQFEISWPSVKGRSYSVERGADLNGDMSVLGSQDATPPTNSWWIDTSSNQTQFFKVVEADHHSVLSLADMGTRKAAWLMNERLGKGNNLMASKAIFGHAYVEDFLLLRQSGFSHCRLGYKLDLRVGASPEYLIPTLDQDRLLEVANFAIQTGLNIIIDPVHDWNNSDGFTGSEADFSKLVKIWEQVSVLFADYPTDQVVFEIMNEPSVNHDYERIIIDALAAIRSVPGNENRVVIVAGGYGAVDGNNALNYTTREALINAFDNDKFPIDDANLIGTFHYYDPKTFTKQGDPSIGVQGRRWGAQNSAFDQVEADFDAVVNANNAWAVRNNTTPLPIYLGEFGTDNAVDLYNEFNDRKRWLSWIRLQAEKRNFSWAHWNMYNNSLTSQGMGPWNSSFEDAVYFNFDATSANPNNTYADRVNGAHAQSVWAVPVFPANGFTGNSLTDGYFTLTNDGTKATYYGQSKGSLHRTEWGMTYNSTAEGNENSIGGTDSGNIETGFAANSGKFTIEFDLLEWDLSSSSLAPVMLFQARDANDPANVVLAIKLFGDRGTAQGAATGVQFDFLNESILDTVAGASAKSLFAPKLADFIPDTVSDDAFTLKKINSNPYNGGSYGDINRGEWGLSYNAGLIENGFNVDSGNFTVQMNISEWDLSQTDGSSIIFQVRNADNPAKVLGGFKIEKGNVNNPHTLLKGIKYNGSQHGAGFSYAPWNPADGGNLWSMNRIKSNDFTGTSADLTGPIGMRLDMDNETITIFANGNDFTVSSPGLSTEVINSVRLNTRNFGDPDFVTIDDLSIFTGNDNTPDTVVTYSSKIQGIAYDSTAQFGNTFKTILLDANSASGNLSGENSRTGITVDFDTNTYTLFANGESHSYVSPETLSNTILETVRLNTINLEQPDFVSFDNVSFYKGTISPKVSGDQDGDGLVFDSEKTTPSIRRFDPEPLEALVGHYEVESVDSNVAGVGSSFPGYSGSGYVTVDSINSCTATVYSPREANFNLLIRYSSAENSSINLQVGSGVSQNIVLPATGMNGDWLKVSTTAFLSAGDNVLSITSNPGESNLIDWIWVKASD